MTTQVCPLTYELSENGHNVSMGKRQMLCMARALLTRTRIVVVDEATASIDHTTEKKLQEMAKCDFHDAMALTVDQLGTMLDSDRIMMLSDGRVVEFDSPRNLVKGVPTDEGRWMYSLLEPNNGITYWTSGSNKTFT